MRVILETGAKKNPCGGRRGFSYLLVILLACQFTQLVGRWVGRP